MTTLNQKKNNQKSRGFTVVEVAVVAPIVMLIVLAIFAIITVLLQSSAAERVRAQNLYDVRTALTAIEKESALTGSFLPSTETGMNDTNAPSGGWSYQGSSATSRTLILQSYATTTNPLAADRRPVFLNDQGCSADSIFYNQPLTYNTLYFVKDKTLYRRLLVNTSKPTCDDPYQKQTCQSGGGCAADDEVVATDVTTFTVDYYPDSASNTAYTAYTDSLGDQEVTSSNSALVTIGMTRRAYGQPLTSSMSLRVSKIITGNTND